MCLIKCLGFIYIYIYYMSKINKILIKNISSKKLRKYFYKEVNRNYKSIKYEDVCNIFHSEINEIDLYGNIDNNENKNLEHIFPRSYFKDDERNEIMRSDLHNLYLCDSKLNNYRENFKYVDIDTYSFDYNEVFLDNEGNKIENDKDFFINQGCIMTINKNDKVIIPSNYSKGKIARSLAYFAIKYNYVDEIKNIIDIDTMIKWSLNDPVDNEEYFKNILCYKYQNNYNPFIIDSELIMYCFLDMTDINIDELLSFKRTKEIDHMETIEYLIRDNKMKQKEINDLNNKIKDLEDALKNM